MYRRVLTGVREINADMSPAVCLQVRVVDVIRETGASGRRKRQTGVTYFYIEVGDAADDTSSPVDIGE